jgi:CubicO group peptidase (beta-lactamase class C family)
MRTLMIAITLVVLLGVSLAVGLFAADWPFWERAWSWHVQPWPRDLPGARVRIAGAAGSAAAPSFAAGSAATAPEARLLAVATALPESTALLVLSGEALLLERHATGATAATMHASRELAGVLPALLYGIALAEGRVPRLDAAVAAVLPEWSDDARGVITPRQLLWNLSGLEAPPFAPWNPLQRRARLGSGPDFARAALAFRAVFPPGSHFEPSPANPQLLGLLLERATGIPVAEFLQARLWQPLGAAPATAMLDRAAGRMALHCCFAASARDWLRIGALLANDGMFAGRRVLPAGWVAQMATASPVHPGFGLGLYVERTDSGNPLYRLAGTGRDIWILPQQRLVVLRFVDAVGADDAAAVAPLRAALQAM